MPAHLLTDALDLARTGWKRLLVVVAAGALVLGVLGRLVLDGTLVIPSLALVGVSLLALVAFAAGRDAQVVPRLVAQVAVAASPLLVAGALLVLGAKLHPLIGLVMVPLAFVLLWGVLPLVVLAIGAVLAGDDGWVPRAAWRALRGRIWTLGLLAAAGAIAAMFLALPVALAGFLLTAVLGPLGFLGIGLVASAFVPLVTVASIVAWRQLGHVVAQAAPAAAQTGWSAGPSWDIALEPGTPWGSWLQLSEPTRLAVQFDWSGIAPPHLRLCDEHGAWRETVQPVASGATVSLDLPAGATWLQLASQSIDPQHARVQVFVPVTDAASRAA